MKRISEDNEQRLISRLELFERLLRERTAENRFLYAECDQAGIDRAAERYEKWLAKQSAGGVRR